MKLTLCNHPKMPKVQRASARTIDSVAGSQHRAVRATSGTRATSSSSSKVYVPKVSKTDSKELCAHRMELPKPSMRSPSLHTNFVFIFTWAWKSLAPLPLGRPLSHAYQSKTHMWKSFLSERHTKHPVSADQARTYLCESS